MNISRLYKKLNRTKKHGLKGISSQFKTIFFKDLAYKEQNKFNHLNVSTPNELVSSKNLLVLYSHEDFVRLLLEKSPQTKNHLQENGLKGKIYTENILKIIDYHLTTTTNYALKIAQTMNLSSSDKLILEQACVFHDFGKILVPKEILEKPNDLNDIERNIMNLHAEIGADLLSKTGMHKRVIKLIKDHHMPQTINNDVLGKILSVADIYSALREQRCYKKPLSEKEAILILDQKAMIGEVSTEVVNVLKSLLVKTIAA